MSRWPPSRLRITLFPDGLQVCSGGVALPVIPVLSAATGLPWSAALRALRDWGLDAGLRRKSGWERLRSPAWGRRARVRLSSHWSRFVVLPAGRGSLRGAGLTDLARALLAASCGEEWATAQLRIAPALQDEGQFVAAVQPELLEELRDTLGGLGLGSASIAPLFTDQLDGLRVERPCPERFTVASLEAGRMVLATVGPNAWEGVRSPLVSATMAPVLARELAREQLRNGATSALTAHIFSNGLALGDELAQVAALTGIKLQPCVEQP